MSFEYMEAAKALRRIMLGSSGLKTAIFDSKARNLKRVYAIVTECSKRLPELERVVKQCGLLKAAQEAQVDTAMMYVMVYDLLYGAGKINGGGAVKRVIRAHEEELRKVAGVPAKVAGAENTTTTSSALSAVANGLLLLSNGSAGGGGGGARPRHVRVNTLRIESVAAAISSLCDPKQSPTGLALTTNFGASSMEMTTTTTTTITTPTSQQQNFDIHISPHVPTMLSLPSTAHTRLELHNHPLVRSGALILQDLASAFPAHALLGEWKPYPSNSRKAKSSLPPLPFDVIDACAAPGNKTSQLAALVVSLCTNPPSATPWLTAADNSTTKNDNSIHTNSSAVPTMMMMKSTTKAPVVIPASSSSSSDTKQSSSDTHETSLKKAKVGGENDDDDEDDENDGDNDDENDKGPMSKSKKKRMRKAAAKARAMAALDPVERQKKEQEQEQEQQQQKQQQQQQDLGKIGAGNSASSSSSSSSAATNVSKKEKHNNKNTAHSPSNSIPVGTVFAFDRDPSRCELLTNRMKEAGAYNVQTACENFLSVSPSDPKYANVRAILLDPSCSGSGMKAHTSTTTSSSSSSSSSSSAYSDSKASGNATKRSREEMEAPTNMNDVTATSSAPPIISSSISSSSSALPPPPEPPAVDEARVRSLADFQRRALIHALSFPQVKRVVYSTCSLYVKEDEAVVASVLREVNGANVLAPATTTTSTNSDKDVNKSSKLTTTTATTTSISSDASASQVRVIPCLPSWPYRGYALGGLDEQSAKNCVRCDPARDGTTGFFVALFEKV